jgi:hypothetical protein
MAFRTLKSAFTFPFGSFLHLWQRRSLLFRPQLSQTFEIGEKMGTPAAPCRVSLTRAVILDSVISKEGLLKL